MTPEPTSGSPPPPAPPTPAAGERSPPTRSPRRSFTADEAKRAAILYGCFDTSFRHFVAPALIRKLHVLNIVLFIVVCAIGLFVMSTYKQIGEAIAIGTLIIFLAVVGLISARLALETVMVIFRIAEHLVALRHTATRLVSPEQDAPHS